VLAADPSAGRRECPRGRGSASASPAGSDAPEERASPPVFALGSSDRDHLIAAGLLVPRQVVAARPPRTFVHPEPTLRLTGREDWRRAGPWRLHGAENIGEKDNT
jgi:hypothetical protein